MKKIIKIFFIALLSSLHARSQADLKNEGILFISSTDTLFINGNFTNLSSASFTNNGWFNLKQNFTNSQLSMPAGIGTLYLNGTANQSISSTAGSAFYNFTVNKSSGLVTLATDATINNNLTLTSGKFSLGNFNLSIGIAGNISGAGSSNYIIAENSGVLTQQVSNNSTKAFPVGTLSYYIPASIGLTI